MNAGRSSRGAALVLVLWLIVMMIGLIGGFAKTAAVESAQAHQLRAALIARQAARAGVEYAVLHMNYTDVDRRWVPDGRKYPYAITDARGNAFAKVEIRIIDESGKVDLNGASVDMLHKLLLALDVAEPRAQAVAAAIVDFRDPDDLITLGGAEKDGYSSAGLPFGPKNRPFEAVSELQRVLGMDFALFQKLEPYVTVYASGDPSPTFAQPPVLQALGMSSAGADQFRTQREAWQPGTPGAPPAMPDGQPFVVQPGTGTYDISSKVHLADGTNLTVNAIVRASQPGPFGQLYVPLQWREGESY